MKKDREKRPGILTPSHRSELLEATLTAVVGGFDSDTHIRLRSSDDAGPPSTGRSGDDLLIGGRTTFNDD